MKRFLPLLFLFIFTTSLVDAKGGRSFSSGKSFKPSRSFSSGSKKSFSSPKSPSRKFGSSPSSKSKGFSSPNKAPSIDSSASSQQRKAESRIKYQSAQAKQSTAKNIQSNQVWKDSQKNGGVSTLNTRREKFYKTAPSVAPTTVFHQHHYNDHYNGMFWGFLLGQSLSTRADWTYNHRDTIDPVRYNELINHDAQLAARVAELERERGGHRDPNYVPSGLPSNDLMYDDSFIKNSNPGSHWVWWTFGSVVVVSCIGAAVYGIFIYRPKLVG